MFLKIILLVLFFAVMLGVGLYCRRHATDVNGFVLGSRSVGPWLTAFAYGTSYFSAVIFVGYAGQFGWRFGIASTWIGIGNALIGSLAAWAVLGRRTRLMSRHLASATMPEFFEKRFRSKGLKIAAALIIFVFLIPYTASLYNGLSRLFGMAFHIDYSLCIFIMAVLTCIYVIAGGYMATAINDFIQGIIMLFGIVAVVAAVLKSHGGFTQSLAALASVSDASVSDVPGIFSSFFGPEPLNLLCVIILTSLGTWGLPQMVQKFYAIKSENDIHTGTIVSTIFALIVAGGCYFLGGFGRLMGSEIDLAASGYDAIIPTMVSHLPDGLIALVVILVLAASMSTLSSLVLTSSSTLVLDLLKISVAKKANEKQQLSLIRFFVMVFIAISAVIAILQYNRGITFIAQFMGISWGALAGAFLAPMIYSLYWKKVTKASVWACFIYGVGISVLNLAAPSLFPAFLQSPINCGAVVMVTSLLLLPLVALFTKKLPGELTEHVFSCYDKKVVVSARDALTESEPAEK